MNKKKFFEFLNKNKINYTHFNHQPVFTSEEANLLNLPNEKNVIKNIFICDDKKRNFFLICLPSHKKIDLIFLQKFLNTRRLKLASEKYLKLYLNLVSGSVNPLGILNDSSRKVTLIFDNSLKYKNIGIHPMENNATIFLEFEDLLKIIKNHGNDILFLDLK